ALRALQSQDHAAKAGYETLPLWQTSTSHTATPTSPDNEAKVDHNRVWPSLLRAPPTTAKWRNNASGTHRQKNNSRPKNPTHSLGRGQDLNAPSVLYRYANSHRFESIQC